MSIISNNAVESAKHYRLTQDERGVAYVEIISGTMNILGTPAIAELTALFHNLGKDGSLRCVVLTGSGDKAFIGGADIREMATLAPDEARVFITRLHGLCEAVRTHPVPVIGRINGWCLGGGLELAAACDFRIAAKSAHLGMPEVHMGLPSVIHAALLPRLIGTGRTRWWLLTGEIISAETAVEWGLVDVTAEPGRLDEAVEHAVAAILKSKPKVIRAQKVLNNAWDDAHQTEALLLSVDAFAAAFETGEPAECMNAWLERKRK